MQKLKKKSKLLKLDGVDKKKVKMNMKVIYDAIRIYKRNSFIGLACVSILHLIFVMLSNKTTWVDYIYLLITSTVFFLLLLLVTWMRGAGTVTSDPNLPGFTRL